jgi:hypothetical protein
MVGIKISLISSRSASKRTPLISVISLIIIPPLEKKSFSVLSSVKMLGAADFMLECWAI